MTKLNQIAILFIGLMLTLGCKSTPTSAELEETEAEQNETEEQLPEEFSYEAFYKLNVGPQRECESIADTLCLKLWYFKAKKFYAPVNYVIPDTTVSYFDTVGTLIDFRDDNEYGWVKINGQTWLSENLRYNNNGNSYCYENKPENCEKYGALYDWPQASNLDPNFFNYPWYESDELNSDYYDVAYETQGLCMNGWHIPSKEEWGLLISFIANTVGEEIYKPFENEYKNLERSNIGRFITQPKQWGEYEYPYASNPFRLSFLPSGRGLMVNNEVEFMGLGKYGAFWLSTVHSNEIVWSVHVSDWLQQALFIGEGQHVESYIWNITHFVFSIRCVKD